LKEPGISSIERSCDIIATWHAKKQQKPLIRKNGGGPDRAKTRVDPVKTDQNTPHKTISRIIIPLKHFKFIGRRGITGMRDRISFEHKSMTMRHKEYVPHTFAAKKRASLPGNQPIGSMRDFGFPCSRRDFGKGE
jgi:hypothetical protein